MKNFKLIAVIIALCIISFATNAAVDMMNFIDIYYSEQTLNTREDVILTSVQDAYARGSEFVRFNLVNNSDYIFYMNISSGVQRIIQHYEGGEWRTLRSNRTWFTHEYSFLFIPVGEMREMRFDLTEFYTNSLGRYRVIYRYELRRQFPDEYWCHYYNVLLVELTREDITKYRGYVAAEFEITRR